MRVEVHVSCALYKLAHDANMLVCLEFFGIGKNIVALIFQKFVRFVNIVFESL
jgi:hypothetical protein